MSELELLRKIVAEWVGLSDLLKMGMSVDDGNALLARCKSFNDNSELIGTPRQVGQDTVYDVMVSLSVDVPGIPATEYRIMLWQDGNHWKGILNLEFTTMAEASTPREALKGVLERITIGIKEEYLDYSEDSDD